MQVTNTNAKGAFFFLREAGRTLSDGGKIITCVTAPRQAYQRLGG